MHVSQKARYVNCVALVLWHIEVISSLIKATTRVAPPQVAPSSFELRDMSGSAC
jgi:hypothetical protein